MRDCSEIIPVVSFATLSYMLPPPFLGGGIYARKLMKYVSVRPWFCPHALLLKPLKRVSTAHTCISGLYTKTCRANLILVRISQAARFVGLTLSSLSSRLHIGPLWMFIPLKLHVFMAV